MIKKLEELANADVDYDSGEVHLNGTVISIDEANDMVREAGISAKVGGLSSNQGGGGLIADPAVMQRDTELLESIIILLLACAVVSKCKMSFLNHHDDKYVPILGYVSQ